MYSLEKIKTTIKYIQFFKTCLMTVLLIQKFEKYRYFKQPMSGFYSRTDFNHFALKANKTDDGTTTHYSRLI